MTGTVDKRALFLGIGAPQHKDEMLLTLVQFPDHSIGEPFPTAASVRSGLMSPHGQNRVDQQNTLIGPALQSEEGNGLPRSLSISRNMLTSEGGNGTPSSTEKHSP